MDVKQYRLFAKGTLIGSVLAGLIIPMATVKFSSRISEFPEFVALRVYSAYFSVVDTSSYAIEPWNAPMAQHPGTWMAFLIVLVTFGFAFNKDQKDEYQYSKTPVWLNILLFVGWIAGGWIALNIYVFKEFLPALLYQDGNIPSTIVVSTSYGLSFYLLIIGLLLTATVPMFAQSPKTYVDGPQYQGYQQSYQQSYQGGPQSGYQSSYQDNYQSSYSPQSSNTNPIASKAMDAPKKLPMFCASCGTRFEDSESRFCINCGASRTA